MTNCPACKASEIVEDGPYLNAGPRAHAFFEGLSVLLCKACGTGWVARPPSDNLLGEYYSTNYTPAAMKGLEEDIWPRWDERAASLIAVGRIFGDFKEDDLFIDVGPGGGAALGLANWMLPSPRLGCVEFNEKSIAYFRRHMPDIVVTQSLQAFEPGSAGMIYSAHSLEHFQPDSLSDEIGAVFRTLRPGGVFALEVPLQKATTSKYHTPHLTFFSEEGVNALLSGAGLRVCHSFLAEGRIKKARIRVARRYRQDFPAQIRRARMLTTGDLVPSPNPAEGVIKCFAVKP